jgi:hypothetical protein
MIAAASQLLAACQLGAHRLLHDIRPLLPGFHKLTSRRYQTFTTSAYSLMRKVKRTVRGTNMEFIVLGGITVVALVAWGLCLTRISCPFDGGKRKPRGL